MTKQTNPDPGHAGVSIPVDPDEIASISYGIDRLNLAAKVMKLALAAADKGPDRVALEQPTPTQLLENWLVTNLLVSTAFNMLFFEVLNAIETMKRMVSRQPD